MVDLHVFAVTFGVLGNIISFLVFLAPVPTFYRIYKKKSTENFQSLPYQVALFSCMMWLYYALIKETAFLIITINSFGCVVETLYISMFLAYAPKKSRVSAMKLFAALNMGLFLLILVVTQFLVKSSIRIQVLGWINLAISVCVFAAPLNIMATVIRTRSVEFMPFNLSFFLTLSATIWFSYGAFIKDIWIAIPNVVGFFLGMIQMLLYGIYRNSDKVAEETNNSIVGLNKLGSSEVHPTDIDIDTNNNINELDKENDQTTELDDHHKSLELSSEIHLDESTV